MRDDASHRDLGAHFRAMGIDREPFIYGSPDSTTLLYLLLRLGDRVRLLVGHSKGDYCTANAVQGWLEAWGRGKSRRRGKRRILMLANGLPAG